MTKKELIHSVHRNCHLDLKASEGAVNAIFNVIRHELSKGKNVVLRNFGEFKIRHKAGRRARNPKTGEDAWVRPRTVVGFKASRKLKESVDNGN